MGVDIHGHAHPHLHSLCLRCGYAARFKQWPIRCACNRGLTRSADARFGARPPMCGLARSPGDCSQISGRPANTLGTTASSVDMLDSPTTPA